MGGVGHTQDAGSWWEGGRSREPLVEVVWKPGEIPEGAW